MRTVTVATEAAKMTRITQAMKKKHLQTKRVTDLFASKGLSSKHKDLSNPARNF